MISDGRKGARVLILCVKHLGFVTACMNGCESHGLYASDLASSHKGSAYKGLNFSCWEAAWFQIPLCVSSEAATSLNCCVPFVSNYYFIEFSKSTDPTAHLNTLGRLS